MKHNPSQNILEDGHAQVIINTVNCKGVMGAGLAKAFKDKFGNDLMDPYKKACSAGAFGPGKLQPLRFGPDNKRKPGGLDLEAGDFLIINMATKDHWKQPSKIEWIDEALQKLAGFVEKQNISSISFPKMGAGLGGLEWKDVHALIDKHFGTLDQKGLDITICGEKPEAIKNNIQVVNFYKEGFKKGQELPTEYVDISRNSMLIAPDGKNLGNSHVMQQENDRELVIRKFARDFAQRLVDPLMRDFIKDNLAGKKLACFCAPKSCHGDVIKASAQALLENRDPVEAISQWTQSDVSRSPAYAGIGARKTPQNVMNKMTRIAEILSSNNWVLRSGAAKGADTAFEDGAGKNKQIFIPWTGFEGRQYPVSSMEKEMEIAKQFHPAWDKLRKGGRAMQGRNCNQILGPDLDQPANCIICWTEGGKIIGGTGQSLRMAEYFDIPVINLGSEKYKNATAEDIAKDALAYQNIPTMKSLPSEKKEIEKSLQNKEIKTIDEPEFF